MVGDGRILYLPDCAYRDLAQETSASAVCILCVLQANKTDEYAG